jgi:hypothetical protein
VDGGGEGGGGEGGTIASLPLSKNPVAKIGESSPAL